MSCGRIEIGIYFTNGCREFRIAMINSKHSCIGRSLDSISVHISADKKNHTYTQKKKFYSEKIDSKTFFHHSQQIKQ